MVYYAIQRSTPAVATTPNAPSQRLRAKLARPLYRTATVVLSHKVLNVPHKPVLRINGNEWGPVLSGVGQPKGRTMRTRS